MKRRQLLNSLLQLLAIGLVAPSLPYPSPYPAFFSIGVEFTNTELLPFSPSISDSHLQMAVAALSNQIDLDGTEHYKDVFNL